MGKEENGPGPDEVNRGWLEKSGLANLRESIR
jgi:hypothetical protein